jgi:high-affinity Fe2+/Pb2+ permease
MIKQPIRVICLAIIVVLTAIWNGLRLGETIFFWKTLQTYGALPLYIAISGGIWLFAGLLLAWGLWSGKAWGWAAMLLGTVGYASWYWFDRLVLQKPHANWLFVLAANFVLLLIIFVILFSRRTREFYKRDENERKPQTPPIA